MIRVTPLHFALALALATLVNGGVVVWLAGDWHRSAPAEDPVYVNIVALGIGDSAGAGRMPQGAGIAAPGIATPLDGPPPLERATPDEPAVAASPRPTLADQSDAELAAPVEPEADTPAVAAEPAAPQAASPDAVEAPRQPAPPAATTPPSPSAAATQDSEPMTSPIPERSEESPPQEAEPTLRIARNLPMRAPEAAPDSLQDVVEPQEPEEIVAAPERPSGDRPGDPVDTVAEEQPLTQPTVPASAEEPAAAAAEPSAQAPEDAPPLARITAPETPSSLPAATQPDIGSPVTETEVARARPPAPAPDETAPTAPVRPAQPAAGSAEAPVPEPVETGQAFVTVQPVPPIQPAPHNVADLRSSEQPQRAPATPVPPADVNAEEASPATDGRLRAGAAIAPVASEAPADNAVANAAPGLETVPAPLPDLAPPDAVDPAGREGDAPPRNVSTSTAERSPEAPSRAPSAEPVSSAAEPLTVDTAPTRPVAAEREAAATPASELAPVPTPPTPPRGLADGEGPAGVLPPGVPGGAEGGTVAAGSPLDHYATDLHTLIDAYKRYPRTSRERREQGTVTLRITVAPDGTLVNVAVENAQSERLSAASVDAVRNAADLFPPFPPGLVDQPLQFIVSVSFVLR